MAAITSSEILLMYSTKSGSAGNTVTSTAAGSLGKYISTSEWANLAALFDNIDASENAAGVQDYRCVFVKNTNSANAYTNAVVYISTDVPGGATVALAVDNLGPVAVGSGSAQAAEIATETTAPVGVGAFSSPLTPATGLLLGTIPPGFCKAFWVRRTATNSAGLSNDGVTISVSGGTGSL